MAAAIAFDPREKNFQELSEFQLADDDTYDARCGEVFITLNRVLVFHCTICDKKYGSFDYFLEHLSAVHYKDIHEEVLEIETETERSESETKCEIDELNFDETFQEEDEVKLENQYNYLEIDGYGVEADLDIKPNLGEEYLEDIADEEFDDVNDYHGNDEKYPGFLSQRHELRKNYEVYNCNKCGKKFQNKPKLKKHLITHSDERKHKCKICGFAFKERSNLNAHVRRHLGVKKIGCEMCSKKFFTRTEAATHQRTHTGERPYICSSCGMTFTTSGALNEHAKRHNNVRPHKCNHCDKRFYDSCQLKDHMPVHTHERPFVCAICSASFARRKSLRAHMKLHINAKEYECHLCDKSFNQKPGLLAHIKINHKVVSSNKTPSSE